MIILLLHIVRSGETVRMIADNYQCEISDITSNNLHITDFKNLKAGMKIKIPILSKPIMDVLEETESFISDYYPNLSEEIKEDFNKKVMDVKINEPIPINDEVIKEPVIETVVEQKATEPRYISGKINYFGNVIPDVPKEFIKKI